MAIAEYTQFDATRLAELIKKKEITPQEALEAALDRCADVNPKLNAVVGTYPERAARTIEAGVPDGPFSGVPFLLKDQIALEGTRLTLGSVFLRDNIATDTHELVRRQQRAGVVHFGRTNMSELGLVPFTEPTLHGPTHNPWNLLHSPGGSSGGSASAVAARIVPMAHAADGGGSIRIPAANCGVFGLKPSRGRNPGAADDEPEGFVVNHCVSISVRDSARMLDVTAGPLPGERWWAPPPEVPFAQSATRDPRRLRIAFSVSDFTGRRAHPDCVAAVEDVAKLCEALGHDVEEARPGFDGIAYNEAFIVLWSMIAGYFFKAILGEMTRLGVPKRAVTALNNLALFDVVTRLSTLRFGKPPFETFTKRLARMEAGYSPGDLWVAWNTMQRAGIITCQFLQQYDVLLTPVLGAPPRLTGDFNPNRPIPQLKEDLFAYTGYTPISNTAGLPAMSIPLYWNDAGLPIGTQFMGGFADESTLFALAGQLERARPWAHRIPSF
ncbi:MAG: hypothetical protein A2289_13415 [Deltaproteobacteria bacterium RIFOXYA12_FULL_58_15]|nr:MAG: hypothetical protein A2289_13415 [Deltaproteobacteria bacterium RIFOXYA12_FULL_58_15]